ncbi:MAG: ATPase, partial [Chloroflexi bacterium]|nr:ATPase [Chloroflexota bacterium]
MGRLAGVGPEGDRVLQLRSPFGGGKTHVLLALYHAARDHAAIRALPEASDVPDPGPVRVAVFDGEKFDNLISPG